MTRIIVIITILSIFNVYNSFAHKPQTIYKTDANKDNECVMSYVFIDDA